MPEIVIRPVIANDIPALLGLEHWYETSHVWQMDRLVEGGQVAVNFREVRLPRKMKVESPVAGDWLVEGWKSQPGLLAAVFEDQPVGYICLSEGFGPGTAWVRDLLVAEKMRRKGLGTALLLAGHEWAGQRNYRRVLLEMQSKNFPAMRMAFKLGYEFGGYNDHYYSNQDIAVFFTRYLR
jgi:GNAT superfamily N-acetyltransferase